MQLTDLSKKKNSELWSRFLSGDDEAFVQLYTLNIDAMLHYGLHFTPLRDQVKDAVQNVFTTIYDRRDKLSQVENVRVYLLVSLKNNLFAMFDKDMRFYQIDTMEPVFHIESSAEEAYIISEQENELRQNIQGMLSNLSPRQREAIYYRFTEGMSFEDICRLMQMNMQSVRNLLHRSITKIRETYMEYQKNNSLTKE